MAFDDIHEDVGDLDLRIESSAAPPTPKKARARK